MKYPKLYQKGLCALCLCVLFALFLLLYIFVLTLLPPTAALVLAVAGAAAAIWWLIRNLMPLIAIEMCLISLSLSAEDRLVYHGVPDAVGREGFKELVLQRCRKWGKAITPASADWMPVGVFFRRRYSPYEDCSGVRKTVWIYETAHLDEGRYRRIMAAAMGQFVSLPPLKKASKELPVEARLVLILADTVEKAVPNLVRQQYQELPDGCRLPCVVDCTAARMYVHGEKEPYFGMGERPAKNMALSLIKKLVCGGRLPLSERDKVPESAETEELRQTSLWDFWREMKKEQKETDRAADREKKRMATRLKDGEVCRGEHAIYVRIGERMIAWGYMTDEDEPQTVWVATEEFWVHPRKSRISKRDKEWLCEQIEKRLAEEDLRCRWDPLSDR